MNSQSPIAVSVHKLSKTFGHFTAVNNISFTVAKGEIFGFLGANGAGKTTTIRMLCGLLLPTSGEATVAGCDVWQNSEEIKKRIGYMSQKFSLYEDLTVSENIQFYGGVYGLSVPKIKQQTAELLETLNLEKQARTLTNLLPLGWKQRLALSCAILHDPEIVFLDEPTSGVDPEARKQFWQIIGDLAQTGKTIFVTTHYLAEAENCHRLSIMKDGAILALDTPGGLKERYGETNMEEVFVKAVTR